MANRSAGSNWVEMLKEALKSAGISTENFQMNEEQAAKVLGLLSFASGPQVAPASELSISQVAEVLKHRNDKLYN